MPPASLSPASPLASYRLRFWGSERISYLRKYESVQVSIPARELALAMNDVRVGHFFEEFWVTALVWMQPKRPETSRVSTTFWLPSSYKSHGLFAICLLEVGF